MRCLAPTLLAGLLFGAVAVAWTYPLARDPSRLAAIAYDQSEQSPHESTGGWGPIVRNDQLLSIALPARNAESLLAGRLRALLDNGLCFPLQSAAAFGEHMIEFSLLTLPVYALTGDPLVSYNVGCFLEVMLMGMTCFALLRYWTSDIAASFIGALLLVFHPWRLDLFAHPALVSLHWLPLTLLLFERLLGSPKLRDAALLCATAVLQLLTASYLAITFALFAGVYGCVRLFGQRQQLQRRSLVLLALSIVAAAAAVVPVLIPYLDAQNTWSLQRVAESTTVPWTGLLPGGSHAAGGLALILASVVPIFRTHGRNQPAGAVLAASAACFLLSITVPGMDTLLGEASVYDLLRDRVPLLSLIRVPGLLRVGGYLGMSLLAGMGLARLGRAVAPRTRRQLVLGAAVVAVVELFYTPVTLAVYESHPRVVMRELRPSDAVLEAYAALDATARRSPILDLPFEYTRVVKGRIPEYVLFSAYHLHPAAACYNSFFGPVYENVGRIAERYWNEGPPDELLALGLDSLVIHDPARWMISINARKDASTVAATGEAIAARLTGKVQTHGDATRLRTGRLQLARAPMPPHGLALSLEVTNDSAATWRLPAPPRPTAARLTWERADATGDRVDVEGSLLLPLALASGRSDRIGIATPKLPPPGTYQLTVSVPDLKWVVGKDIVIPSTQGARP